MTGEELGEIPFFGLLSAKSRERIAPHVQEVHALPGETLTRVQDFAYHVHVVVTGQAAVRARGQQVETIGPGDSFGERSSLEMGMVGATVVALTKMHVLVLSMRLLQELVEAEPEFGDHVRALAAEHPARG